MKEETDALDSRDFYELCQQYRWSQIGADEFKQLKDWIRLNAVVKSAPVNPIYTD